MEHREQGLAILEHLSGDEQARVILADGGCGYRQPRWHRAGVQPIKSMDRHQKPRVE